MNVKKTILLSAMGLIMAAGAAASGASAETRWDAHHPARVEVNHRLHNQAVRIHEARKAGEMGAMKAHRLHVADHRIRMQERRDAARHGGHLTKVEKMKLNHEENAVSRKIG
jgi:hypothetical protein